MKVRCIRDCYYKHQHCVPYDEKRKGIYDFKLEPGEKLSPHFVPLEVAPAPEKGKKVKPKPLADAEKDDVLA